MFYIPEMYSVNAPAPLSVGIFVGHNWEKNCYVVSINGNYTWKRAMKIHKVLPEFHAVLKSCFKNFGLYYWFFVELMGSCHFPFNNVSYYCASIIGEFHAAVYSDHYSNTNKSSWLVFIH